MSEGSYPLEVKLSPHSDIFLRHVEWWDDTSRFVLVRYADAAGPREYGIRFDLDKKVFLDSLGNAALDQELLAFRDDIVAGVARGRGETIGRRWAAAAG